MGSEQAVASVLHDLGNIESSSWLQDVD